MINWLKRLFKTKNRILLEDSVLLILAETAIYKNKSTGNLYRIKMIDRKNREVIFDNCNKDGFTNPSYGAMNLIQNCFDFYMEHTRVFNQTICDQFKKRLKRENERSEQFRKAIAMDKNIKEGDLVYRRADGMWCKSFDEGYIGKAVIINGQILPERKEMEIKVGFKYFNRRILNQIVFIQYINNDQETIQVISEINANKFLFTFEQFSYLYAECKPQLEQQKISPRTLKLEDLKTLWLKKSSGGKILRINTFDKENVYLTPLVHMGYHESQNIKSFFDDFREATQNDIDNLTKGG